MGGSGSGCFYRFSQKDTTEVNKRIDIRDLQQEGLLKPRLHFTRSWSCNGKPSGSISIKTEHDRIRLIYRRRSRGEEEWQDIDELVYITRTPCNFGGSRPWFSCPGCYRRVAIIYGAGKYFLCRHCYNLAYQSQNEHKADRLMRKARKIRRDLGASEAFSESILFKPRNMHQKTFDKLKNEVCRLEDRAWRIIGARWGVYL